MISIKMIKNNLKINRLKSIDNKMNELEKWANQPETEEDRIRAEAIRRARIWFQYKHSVESLKLMLNINEIKIMKEVYFESLLQILKLKEDNLLLKSYFDVQFDLFINDNENFSSKTNRFIENFTSKIDVLYLDDSIVHFSNYQIPDDRFREVVQLTSFKNNIERTDKHKLVIINNSEIYNCDAYDTVDDGVYILTDLNLFIGIYDFFSSKFIK